MRPRFLPLLHTKLSFGKHQCAQAKLCRKLIQMLLGALDVGTARRKSLQHGCVVGFVIMFSSLLFLAAFSSHVRMIFRQLCILLFDLLFRNARIANEDVPKELVYFRLSSSQLTKSSGSNKSALTYIAWIKVLFI